MVVNDLFHRYACIRYVCSRLFKISTQRTVLTRPIVDDDKSVRNSSEISNSYL